MFASKGSSSMYSSRRLHPQKKRFNTHTHTHTRISEIASRNQNGKLLNTLDGIAKATGPCLHFALQLFHLSIIFETLLKVLEFLALLLLDLQCDLAATIKKFCDLLEL